MVSNVEKLVDRNEDLTLLVEKSDNLNQSSIQFAKQSTSLKRSLWWKNAKMILILALSVMVSRILQVNNHTSSGQGSISNFEVLWQAWIYTAWKGRVHFFVDISLFSFILTLCSFGAINLFVCMYVCCLFVCLFVHSFTLLSALCFVFMFFSSSSISLCLRHVVV